MMLILSVLLTTLLLSLFLAAAAIASNGKPLGGYAPSFAFQPIMARTGTNRNMNDDGYIRMKKYSNTLHQHVNHSLPYR